MSLKKPIIRVPYQTTGVESEVFMLNTKIAVNAVDSAGEQWFDGSMLFSIAERNEKDGEPQVLSNRDNFYKLVPNNQLRSFMFFYEHDPRQINQLEAIYDLSLVVWFNQDKYARNAHVRIREFLINSILKVLHSVTDLEDSIQVFTDKGNVYSDFTMDWERSIMMAPYDGFRIRFAHRGEFACDESFDKAQITNLGTTFNNAFSIQFG